MHPNVIDISPVVYYRDDNTIDLMVEKRVINIIIQRYIICYNDDNSNSDRQTDVTTVEYL